MNNIVNAIRQIVKGIRLCVKYQKAIDSVDKQGGFFYDVYAWLISGIANLDPENENLMTEPIETLKLIQMVNDESKTDEEVAEEVIRLIKEGLSDDSRRTETHDAAEREGTAWGEPRF